MSARRNPDAKGHGVVVVGLGRFGTYLATTLTQLGHEVLAIDRDPQTVQRWSSALDRVVQADATDEAALRQLGIADYERVVVCIGAAVEASILTVLALIEVGGSPIWARATSRKHARILSAIGAQHVVFPEAETGERVAHLLVSNMLDFIGFGDDFAIAKVRVPPPLVGRTLAEVAPAARYGVMVVGAKPPGKRYEYVTPGTVLSEGSLLIVEGTIDQVQRFAGMT
ncbi:trk system potassium uptake protein TrkA [Micromonospora pallida]|uniref:Trk system potassium uptake protein TrkA n=1 Tax=Micromonospora pallida TaxID=145854 RepID=A0A1C6TFR3_9ACTN|nr:TrkA family potassium uptake protein [Micromonospora pallida]SCL40574.1 trk system potassium uptake protein TrkA [Micromonospora pallida]